MRQQVEITQSYNPTHTPNHFHLRRKTMYSQQQSRKNDLLIFSSITQENKFIKKNPQNWLMLRSIHIIPFTTLPNI
uniref:Uncharacterized protein n=1 Tax=Rhizophora mucronata TaxID=61149 RepID=A0A2P2P2V6_RHIMU